eukprot:TRINITY_DN4638_c0_g2_i11.p1 TRINITY_DN4638_c0_g2~~TRINITY_DN4638_c0_g2_i11.p1  ORF type:complete len:307 (-),score=57.07 TRINITY_DN4638_c0_g2_i11:1021-1803(-)
MVALNKPSGLQVLPGGLFQQRTVLTQLQWRPEKPNSSRAAAQKSHPVPVHRLGRGTSGILLCAKSKVAKARLAEYFADGTAIVKKNRDTDMEFGITRRILKLYRALATGIIDEDEVVIKQPIGIMHYPGVAKGLYVASSSGKPALSKVTILERDLQENRTLVQVEIHSGRPHQIRIHLAFIGHPLLVDIKDLQGLFLEIVDITCMPIGLFFDTQLIVRLLKSLHHFHLCYKHRKKLIRVLQQVYWQVALLKKLHQSMKEE